MMQFIRDLAPRLLVENHIQLRWETFACEALDVIDPINEARASGDMIIFGPPNAVRGGSHIGSLGAGDMIEAALCDVLASE